MNGVRTNTYIAKPQHKALTNLANRTGLTYAEHVRRAIDFYLAFSEEIHSKVEALAEEK
jgi:predicted DNA-binding protein